MNKKNLRNMVIGGCLLCGVSAPASAFFNPFGMMGSMMGMVAAPVTSQMIGQMLSSMQGLMHSNQFRNDVALFALGTVDEAIYEMMLSLDGGEPTFVGALAESALTGGAPRGSEEYNLAMGHWQTVFGPAMQARMEREEQQVEQEVQIAQQSPAELRQAEYDRRFKLGVYLDQGDYNWDTSSWEPDRLVYRGDDGELVVYIPDYALPGDPSS